MRWTLWVLVACGAVDEGPVGVNEVGPDWVEVYNATDRVASLEGWSLQTPSGATLSLAGSVPALDVLMVQVDELLPASGEAVLTVLDDTDSVVQTITVPALGSGESFGRIPDGIANWQLLPTPSPGGLNSP